MVLETWMCVQKREKQEKEEEKLFMNRVKRLKKYSSERGKEGIELHKIKYPCL